MKSLNIHFRVGGYCSMDIDVPDDYEIPSTHPGEFWRDLRKKVGKKIEIDIMKLHKIEISDFSVFGFYIDQMVLDYFQKVYIFEDNKQVAEINLEHIPIHK